MLATMLEQALQNTHSSWHPIIKQALTNLPQDYLDNLNNTDSWLPGPDKIFNAFSIPRDKVKYVLIGESPYPRAASANGYAFWDAAVGSLWSPEGLSKAVNRATSLRNFMKMLLVGAGLLQPDSLTPKHIASINKHDMVESLEQLFQQLLQHGFLLLNASLVLSSIKPNQEAKIWQPFLLAILSALAQSDNKKDNPTLLLFGQIAKTLQKHELVQRFPSLIAEHPYNISFIHNQNVVEFFQPFRLLNKLKES